MNDSDNNDECESCKCKCIARDTRHCIRNEITNMKCQVERIEEKLDIILQKLDNSIIKNCDKMGDHIDFVNNVYETVKVPLHYISNKIHKIANPLSAGSSASFIEDANTK
jgi:CRISPR/Cas system-associated protein Cas10 (large subunit of type III CRISPR-Cas system)